MTKRTTTNRPEIGARYAYISYCGNRYEMTVIEVDARFVVALDDDKHPLRWTRAMWRRDKPELISAD
ncbi:MAG: hypothetical protein M0P72_09725 [Metallibacterium scheffleri]|jgi:hypothetical protein|uniref:hypothetical protein n=1 Tax=Metallibacterium scheffleri TaxID=993689 RepID=UPI0026F0BCD4|nr:hypothetical protein [Metallibacterium scheffleri]MCK9367409.1 hypothetical protein [Metallibacterium scheffleri]